MKHTGRFSWSLPGKDREGGGTSGRCQVRLLRFDNVPTSSEKMNRNWGGRRKRSRCGEGGGRRGEEATRKKLRPKGPEVGRRMCGGRAVAGGRSRKRGGSHGRVTRGFVTGATTGTPQDAEAHPTWSPLVHSLLPPHLEQPLPGGADPVALPWKNLSVSGGVSLP